MTQGRGSFEYKVTGYDTVPGNIAEKIKKDNAPA
jgi:translation elongation factor EF-G